MQVGHHQIQGGHGILLVGQPRQRLHAGDGRHQFAAQRRQANFQQTVHFRLVIDEQNFGRHIHDGSLR